MFREIVDEYTAVERGADGSSPQRPKRHRDGTEEESLCNLRVLCVSVANNNASYTQPKRILETIPNLHAESFEAFGCP